MRAAAALGQDHSGAAQVHPLVHHRGAAPTSWGPFEALPTPRRLPHIPPAAQSPAPCSRAQCPSVYRPLVALKAVQSAVTNPSGSRCSAKSSVGPAQTVRDVVVPCTLCLPRSAARGQAGSSVPQGEGHLPEGLRCLPVRAGCVHLASLCAAQRGGFASIDQGQCGDSASTQMLLCRCNPQQVGQSSLQRAAAP